MIARTVRSYDATISAIRSTSPPGSITTASLVSPQARMVQLHWRGPAGNVSRRSMDDGLQLNEIVKQSGRGWNLTSPAVRQLSGRAATHHQQYHGASESH